MRRISVGISIGLVLVFIYFFVTNMWTDYDVFYVMWGAILFPLPLAFLLQHDTYEKRFTFRIFIIVFGLLLFVILLRSIHQEPQDPYMMPYPNIYLEIPFTILLLLTSLMSYLILITHYFEFNKFQYIVYGLSVMFFILVRIVFLEFRLLEYIFGAFLFCLLLLNYSYTFITSRKIKNTLR